MALRGSSQYGGRDIRRGVHWVGIVKAAISAWLHEGPTDPHHLSFRIHTSSLISDPHSTSPIGSTHHLSVRIHTTPLSSDPHIISHIGSAHHFSAESDLHITSQLGSTHHLSVRVGISFEKQLVRHYLAMYCTQSAKMYHQTGDNCNNITAQSEGGSSPLVGAHVHCRPSFKMHTTNQVI